MNNELYRIEDDTLIIAKNIIDAIKDFEKEKKEIEEQEQKLREKLLEAMEKYGHDKWVSPDGTLTVTYTPENEVTTFDSKKFKEDDFDTYFKYLKTSTRKASIRMTIKEDEKI